MVLDSDLSKRRGVGGIQYGAFVSGSETGGLNRYNEANISQTLLVVAC